MKKVLALLLVGSAIFFMNARSVGGGYSVGDTVKDFELKNIDGKMVSMSDYPDAKGFILTFTCNTCPFSIGYESRIVDLDKKYAPKGFPVIAINPNDVGRMPEDSMEAMKKRAADKGFTFPYLRDDSQEIARRFGATRTPHMYVISNNSGKYVLEFIGAIDDNPRDGSKVSKKYVEEAVDALLMGKKPPETNVTAIGCTIKWKES